MALGAVALAWSAWAAPACYPGTSGSAPPSKNFYYPVGMAVSRGGNVLYVVNSDFDLQWNGGTLQSYDLFMIRRHTAELINANESSESTVPLDPTIPIIAGYPLSDAGAGMWQPCSAATTTMPAQMSNGTRVFLSQGCSPPVDSSNPVYFKDSAIIGAFATDLQISQDGTRLFSPVRGDGTVTWADLTPDDATKAPQGDPPAAVPTAPTECPFASSANGCWAPFTIGCGQSDAVTGSRCDATHHAGNDPNDPGDTRKATMPGEPFGIALSQDGTSMAVTHQSTGETSLLLTGLPPIVPEPVNIQPAKATCAGRRCNPSMQFVLEGMPSGGNGIAAVPHDPVAVARCEDNGDQAGCVGPAFLETSRLSAEVDLLRYFDDDGSSLHRPFLERERAYPITTNTPATDERGIAIDPTPSLLCKARLAITSPGEACPAAGQTSPPSAACIACGQKPSRVFIASRAPVSVIYGQIGQVSMDGTYDPDALVLQGNVPLLPGASRVYLAPIVDQSGHFALRLFVVSYDSAAVFVFDPDDIMNDGPLAVPEAVMYVGAGPFAMAFDPFTFEDVAAQEADEDLSATTGGTSVVKPDVRQDPGLHLKTYRFGYLASFMNSYVQVIDLDDSLKLPNGTTNAETFEQVVFTLGQLTSPKGT